MAISNTAYSNRVNTAYSTSNTAMSIGNSFKNDDNQNTKISHLFANTKDWKDVTKYNLMRGVPDFGSLVQFNPYESGYACFIICEMPKFIDKLAALDANYASLVDNWKHIIEYEFKSFDGLDDMSADTIQLGDDLNNINVISKVNMQSASEFSLTYDEKSGSPLTKFAKLYLTGIKDPRTQVKSYHGLVHGGIMEPGFENEVFTFLYINTDNTMREVEAAYLLIGCQLNSVNTDMYNYSKGDISKKDVTVKFSGYPISCSQVDECAKDMMTFLLSADAGAKQIIVNSNDFNYTGMESIAKTLLDYNDNDTSKAENYSSYKNVTKAKTKYNTNSYYQNDSTKSVSNSSSNSGSGGSSGGGSGSGSGTSGG